MSAVAAHAPCFDLPVEIQAEHDVQRVNPLDDPHWDAKVRHLPGATFFHGQAWARVLHRTYGFRPEYFVQYAGGELRAVLPTVEVDSWLTGRRGLCLPFTDECELLAADAGSARALVDQVQAFATLRGWKHWEVRGGAGGLKAPAAVSFFGHRVDLDRDPSVLFGRCDSAVRRAVRKAEKSGLTVSFSQSLEETRDFYSLLCKTRRRHGLPPQPFRFFESIQQHILRPRHGCIVLARVGERPVAGAVFFHFGSLALFKFGASDETFQHLRPTNLVMSRALDWHARMGFTSLDLGRTSLSNEGLRRFKLSWGARERRIDYARFDCTASAFVTIQDQASGWHSRLFKFVPAPLARAIGAAAYRHIA